MLKKTTIIFGLIFIMAASVFSSDDKRREFVLGVGLGFTPSVNVGGLNNSGLGYNLIIGHFWDNNNSLSIEMNHVKYTADENNVDYIQGFNGLSWSHYSGQPGRRMFTTVGLGIYFIDNTIKSGIGLLFGVGFEIDPHIQLGTYFSTGNSSDLSDGGFRHLSLLIDVMIF